MSVMRGGRTRFRRRLFGAAAIVVLLAAQSPSVAVGQLAGWSPSHGHMTLTGVVPPHEHPWGQQHQPLAVAVPQTRSENVAFTLSDNGVVNLASAIVLPSDLSLALDRGAIPYLVGPSPVRAPASAHLDVPKPRPRA